MEYVNNGFLRITGEGQASKPLLSGPSPSFPGKLAQDNLPAPEALLSQTHKGRPFRLKYVSLVTSSHIRAGYQREEVIGQKASTFLAGIGTDPQALEALDLAAAKGQDRTIELLHYKRNGSAFCDQVRSLCMFLHLPRV